MAAYAVLVSLMNTMESIRNHTRHSFSFDPNQIQSLLEKVCSLQDFLEFNPHSEEAEVLESKITAAAYEAEDVIESHVVEQIKSGSSLGGKASSCFLVDLQKVIEDMDSVKNMAMSVEAQRGFRDHHQLSMYSKPAVSSRTLTTRKDTMVGFDEESIFQLKDALTGRQPSRQIISIVGMGGIGKTTLAKSIYEDLLIKQHFDVCSWATVSQEYSVSEILSNLLSSPKQSTSGTVNELGEKLYKYLFGRRYLIILDDMWSIEAWEEMQLFLPDNDNGSRVVITTRLSNMAIQFCSSTFGMNFLDEDKSWELFCKKAFGEEDCPHEFEEIGKKIVQKCKGLPLSIVVMGGYLKKSPRTKEYWENVANKVGSFLNSAEDERCMKILSLSYNHLPVHLKPCFLYMGIFPEDNHIWVPDLINLWVAEGFLKPDKSRSLEEIAEDYLNDLFDRNLLLFGRWSRNGKIESCYIHDLLRELCLKVGEKEKFFFVLDTPRARPAVHAERRVITQGKIEEQVLDSPRSATLIRSVLCQGGQLCFDLRLLRVLHEVEILPEAKFQLVNLRYIQIKTVSEDPLHLPSSISLLWNLQTLIIFSGDMETSPHEIWEMPQLRHIAFILTYIPDPRPSDGLEQQGGNVSGNLHTLKGVVNLRLSEEVCKRIPNIKELDILYIESNRTGNEGSSYYCLHNLGGFQKLEALRLSFQCIPDRHDHQLNITFPTSLKELSLSAPHLRWEDLATTLGFLPHLEILELISVEGSEWNPNEGEFLQLKSLKIFYCRDLVHWNVNDSHFPVLQNLEIYNASKLSEIPSGIGEIPTIGLIEISNCSMSAAISAATIVVEQESQGNQELQVVVNFDAMEEVEVFQNMVQELSLNSNNIRLYHQYLKI